MTGQAWQVGRSSSHSCTQNIVVPAEQRWRPSHRSPPGDGETWDRVSDLLSSRREMSHLISYDPPFVGVFQEQIRAEVEGHHRCCGLKQETQEPQTRSRRGALLLVTPISRNLGCLSIRLLHDLSPRPQTTCAKLSAESGCNGHLYDVSNAQFWMFCSSPPPHMKRPFLGHALLNRSYRYVSSRSFMVG